MALTGLGWSLFNWKQLEFYGKLNLLKGGLVFADYISTVSPTYAREIQTPAFGNGLEGVLTERRDRLVGIVNGIDGELWDPETDALLPTRYSARDLAGKAACKAELQRESRLPKTPRAPLVGMISRLVAEKGYGLVLEALPGLLRQGVQVVLLGTGEAKYHEAFAALAKEFPKGFAAHLTFDNKLAHHIEAGADVFLMPSLAEPCGLNQLYSLRYGTVPVVHRTGGIADTITDYSPQALVEGKANGFVLETPTTQALTEALGRALTLYRTNPKAWQQLQLVGMKQDWSWSRSAREYHALYERVAEAGRGRG
jgi:starch synthase